MSTPSTQQLSEPEIQSIVDDAVVWANQHGLVVALAAAGAPERAIVHAPLAALPVNFPKERFMQAKAVQPMFNALVDAVARDEAYLEDTLGAAGRYDPFTGRLLQVLRDTRPARQALQAQGREVLLGVHRSDYMLDAPSGGFLQVELNTIASSFGCLSALVSRMHAYLASRAPQAAQLDPSRLPANPALEALPDGLAAAVRAHGAEGGVVVMVVQPGERNAYDQQWLQLQLWERHRIRTLRLTLAELAQRGRLQPDGTLVLLDQGHAEAEAAATQGTAAAGTAAGAAAAGGQQGTQEQQQQQQQGGTPVSLVYFRAGYTPADYPSETEWGARALVERSNAAKCPSVAYQLAGAKKVQQDLARPGVVERFIADAGDAEQLRTFFAGLWGLDDLKDPTTAAIVSQAIANPDAFVLKPQREGGGNNLYGSELVSRLREGGEGLSAFILMQKILPPPQRSVLVRGGAWEEAEALSELGVYGVFLRRGEEVLVNQEAGHLVRTKRSGSNEGGVAAGFAVLDSPQLV